MSLSKLIDTSIVVVTGHYGCGKTNLSINMALALAKEGQCVTLVDLDIVNPYFRASDSSDVLEAAGVKVVAPVFAGTTLDTPSLGPGIDNAIDDAAAGRTMTIIDVGGDPDGATALGRYRRRIDAAGYQMLYVVNQRRYQTTFAEEAGELLSEIERVSGLAATHIVGNSHLKRETTAQTVVDAIPFAQDVAAITELPLLFVTTPRKVAEETRCLLENTTPQPPELFPVDIFVKTPWE